MQNRYKAAVFHFLSRNHFIPLHSTAPPHSFAFFFPFELDFSRGGSAAVPATPPAPEEPMASSALAGAVASSSAEMWLHMSMSDVNESRNAADAVFAPDVCKRKFTSCSDGCGIE